MRKPHTARPARRWTSWSRRLARRSGGRRRRPRSTPRRHRPSMPWRRGWRCRDVARGQAVSAERREGAMSDLEGLRRAFADVTTCRVATVRPDGGPHVAARWFVWRDDGVWVSTTVGDTTWTYAARDPRISVLIDIGRDWTELAGVRIEGVAEAFPAEHPDL